VERDGEGELQPVHQQGIVHTDEPITLESIDGQR